MIELPAFNLDNSLAWKGIVVHHSATPDGKLNDWAGIKKFHTSYRLDGDIIPEDKALKLIWEGNKKVVKPWADVAYHFGLERVGENLQVMTGRALSIVGAHAVGFNHTHIGVCIVGDFDKAAPTQDVWESTIKLVRGIMYAFRLSSQSVLGHRETFPLRGVPVEKTCPGTAFDLTKFREAL